MVNRDFATDDCRKGQPGSRERIEAYAAAKAAGKPILREPTPEENAAIDRQNATFALSQPPFYHLATETKQLPE